MLDTILFDLDGTLLDTSEGITGGVEYATKSLGLKKLDMATKRLFIGPPLRRAFQKYCCIDEKMAEEAIREYRVYYSGGGMFKCTPYDGIINLLAALKSAGKKLYVATAKPTEFSVKILEKWDMLKYFEEVIGASMDKSLDSKEKIIKFLLKKTGAKDALMIGDTHYDIEGAHQNGVKAVAVFYGFGDREKLKLSCPEYSAETVEQLSELLLNC